MEESKEKTTADQEEHKGWSHTVQQHVDDPVWERLCGLMRQKLSDSFESCYI